MFLCPQRPIVFPKTHVLVAHHLLSRHSRLDAADGALVDVHVQGQALEAAQQQHHRDGQDPGQDHHDSDAEDPVWVALLYGVTLVVK